MSNFVKGGLYKREHIWAQLGLTDTKGGKWATGHVTHDEEHFLFVGVGTGGRTGQNYNNSFFGDQLIWHPQDGANLSTGRMPYLTSGKAVVHVFFRMNDRGPFTYAGRGRPASVKAGPPIEIAWAFDDNSDHIAEELPGLPGVIEGAKKQITVNAYERDASAKPRCIAKWGTQCACCGFDFGAVYGEWGDGFIHVHHVRPLHTIGEAYVLNPEEDLRPVCPNCHAMLHRQKIAIGIEELEAKLKLRFSTAFAPRS